VTIVSKPAKPSATLLPPISVIIPCRNEEESIQACLESIVQSGYPADRLQVLVVDGMSDDRTRPIILACAQRYPAIKLLDNPKQITPAALNIGIANATGEIILRVDAHSQVEKDYLRRCVEVLEHSGADNAGGWIETHPRRPGLAGNAIARCLSHRFGSGSADFRVGREKLVETDTVFGGCYKRDVFKTVGLFNESLTRGQDFEFNRRLRQAGGTIVLDPTIVSHYYIHSDLPSFWKHNFQDGVWAVLPFAHTKYLPVTWRHLAPLVFVAGLLVSTALALVVPGVRWMPLAILAAYGAATTIASVHVANRARDTRYLALMPVVFAVRHFAYGLGSCWGVIRLLRTPSFYRRLFGGDGTPLKRCLDVIVALGGLILLGPFFLLIALLIKLDSPGTSFYRGVRVGRFGRTFRIFKFRTMVANADVLGGPSTSEDDPRVTSFGRWLRRYKTDELPQLINVLKGEMSLVGPRPEVAEEVALYNPEERRLLSVTPGITDWASIRFRHESEILRGSADPHQAYREKIRPEKIRLGLEYVNRHRFSVDLRIILATLFAILGGRTEQIRKLPQPSIENEKRGLRDQVEA
jgi:lipopolysaccharide/colanic/teichoic acid biosynthesis glycosyltransferase/glycosyltransferase involved in cell wall biosynthesis